MNRADLTEVIFTEKEKRDIQQDYHNRLEKIKQKKQRSRVKLTTENYLFTEHNLDTLIDEEVK